jgi:hypothetical protein
MNPMALASVIVIHPITYEIFKKRIRIKTLFSLGQYEPCVCEEGGSKEDLQEFYGI